MTMVRKVRLINRLPRGGGQDYLTTRGGGCSNKEKDS
jgi:hypothetical protein